jgi:hypothetical protein
MISDTCYVCGTELHDLRHGIPIYESVVVPDNWTGPWIGYPVCRKCFDANRDPVVPRLPVPGDAELVGRPT